ncbi:PucR family transcriptional regulator [Microbacterium sp. 2MCAF23]|uniref:PucR family transcriptional regulator n=1 Tax=Microbacterium sp. 2MCAF23 TaxID=3232985 RepID=UPI003F9DAE9E
MSTSDRDEGIAWVEHHLPGLIERVYARSVETLAVYQDEKHVSTGELRRSIEDNLRFLVHALGHPEAPLDPTVPEQTGRRRAHQGVPLPEVLQVYRIGFGILWGALVERATKDPRTETLTRLLSTSTRIWDVAEEHATVLTEAYRAATAEIIIAQEHRRAALVEVLLTGHVSRDAGPWEAASLLGFPSDADLIVVAAQTNEVAAESLPGIARRLAEQGCVSGWRLTPALQLGVVALTRPEALEEVLTVLRSYTGARVGVSPPFPVRTDAPRALRLARAALSMTARGTSAVRVFSPSPIAAMIAADPHEAERLTEDVLGPVLHLPEGDRDVILETLETYIDTGGSAADAAALLHCHPNTVRYRLRRIEELTGRSFTRPSDMAELSAASYGLELTRIAQHRGA